MRPACRRLRAPAGLRRARLRRAGRRTASRVAPAVAGFYAAKSVFPTSPLPYLLYLVRGDRGRLVAPRIADIRQHGSDIVARDFVSEPHHRPLPVLDGLDDWGSVVQRDDRVAGQPSDRASRSPCRSSGGTRRSIPGRSVGREQSIAPGGPDVRYMNCIRRARCPRSAPTRSADPLLRSFRSRSSSPPQRHACKVKMGTNSPITNSRKKLFAIIAMNARSGSRAFSVSCSMCGFSGGFSVW